MAETRGAADRTDSADTVGVAAPAAPAAPAILAKTEGGTAISLRLRPEHIAVCRLPAGSPWPPAPDDGSLFSVTGTEGEVSVVCRESLAPPGSQAAAGWRALSLDGPLAFSAIGIVAGLARTLASARIGIFVLSTFDTDHLLVREHDLEASLAALGEAGYVLRGDH